MSQDNEVLVRVSGVSKKFCRDLKKSLWYGVKDVASELLPFGKGHQQSTINNHQSSISSDLSSSSIHNPQSTIHDPALRPGEFWANKDISFELRRGECIGLIGRNGAGKTTLLKMLNGLIKPDSGTIEMRGRVGALIALGAGFNPILTGRENIYVKGSILGLPHDEIRKKIDEIIDFAEVHEFIDAPVQSYSSGMQVRLGFAVATALNPDILILDEVLAVGDVSFRNKCYRRIGELLDHCAVIFVTHNMAHISRMCSSGLVLSKGMQVFLGDTDHAVAAYNELNTNENTSNGEEIMVSAPLTKAEVRFSTLEIQRDERLKLHATVHSTESIPQCFFYIYVFDPGGQIVAQWSSKDGSDDVDVQPGENQFDYAMGPIRLRGGSYKISVIMKDSTGIRNLVWCDMAYNLVVRNPFYTEAMYQIPNIRL